MITVDVTNMVIPIITKFAATSIAVTDVTIAGVTVAGVTVTAVTTIADATIVCDVAVYSTATNQHHFFSYIKILILARNCQSMIKRLAELVA